MNRSTALVIAIVIGVVFAFFAGIGVGISATTEVKPSTYIADVIGSVGDWISGLGALAAAVIAISLADRQRRDSLPRIEIKQNADPVNISIDIVSRGDRGALILGVFLRSKKLEGQARLNLSERVPKRLDYGELLQISVRGHDFINITGPLCRYGKHSELKDLEVVVETSTNTFAVPAEKEMIAALEGIMSIGANYY